MARPKAFDEDDVLEKALATFWQRGYHATSMQDLVAGMGISRASLYDTFGDKHQLFIRVLSRYQDRSGTLLQALTAAPDVPAPVRIRQLLNALLQQALDDKAQHGCFLVNAATERLPHDPDTAAVAARNQQQLETVLTQVLTQGQARGEVSPRAAPQAQARLLLSVINGMRIMAKIDPDPQLLRDVVQTALLTLV